MNLNNRNFNNCENTSICLNEVFNLKKNNFYNYLHSLIDLYRDDRSMEDFLCIYFYHASFLIPNYIEQNLMQNLELVIDKITENSNANQFELFLQEPGYNTGHIFLIDETTIDYTKYLYQKYKIFTRCFHNYLKTKCLLDNSFIRHLYFLTESAERLGKLIYYYKNVQTIDIHDAEFDKKFWWIADDRKFVSHFRKELKISQRNFSGTIKKLDVDLEYNFFLLKYYSSFCDRK